MTHTCDRHDPGTYACCRHCGCGCFECRLARADYQRQVRQGHTSTVDVATVATQLTRLHDAGWGWSDLAGEIGCHRDTLWQIRNGTTSRVQSRVADAVADLHDSLGPDRLDPEPLLTAIDAKAAHAGGVSALLSEADCRMYYRAAHRGWVSEVWADRVACQVLGMPLPLLYPEEAA